MKATVPHVRCGGVHLGSLGPCVTQLKRLPVGVFLLHRCVDLYCILDSTFK